MASFVDTSRGVSDGYRLDAFKPMFIYN